MPIQGRVVGLCLLFLIGCGTNDSAASRSGAAAPASADALAGRNFSDANFLCRTSPLALTTAVDYDTQIEPLLANSCTSCHAPGKTSPDLSTYAGAKAQAAASLAQIQGGQMPTSAALPAAQVTLFQAWVAGGTVEAAAAATATPAAAGTAGTVSAATGNPACGVSAAVISAEAATPGAGTSVDAGASPTPVPASVASVSPTPTPTPVVSYATDVAPILTAQCISCHKPGAQAPDLTTFATAKAGAAASLKDLTGNLMPPSGPLAATSLAVFQNWVNGGTAP